MSAFEPQMYDWRAGVYRHGRRQHAPHAVEPSAAKPVAKDRIGRQSRRSGPPVRSDVPRRPPRPGCRAGLLHLADPGRAVFLDQLDAVPDQHGIWSASRSTPAGCCSASCGPAAITGKARRPPATPASWSCSWSASSPSRPTRCWRSFLCLVRVRELQAAIDHSGNGGEDAPFGYDFSQGYTSLEGGQPPATAPQRKRPNWFQRWLQKRAAQKARREQEAREAEERRMDELLEKVQRSGIQSLTDEERRFLTRVSARYRGNKS